MRRSLAAVVIALAVVAPSSPSAFAAPKASCASSHDISPKAHAKAAKKAKKAKKVKGTFVNAGMVEAVTTTTLTFKVRGGPDKCLRNTSLTVTVTPDTKITRDDAAVTMSAVLVGDHVNVKGTKKTVVDVGTTYTATRISASAPEPVAPAPVAPAPVEPAPVEPAPAA